MSSVLVMECVCFGRVSMTEVFMLKCAGERTLVLNWRRLDVMFQKVDVVCTGLTVMVLGIYVSVYSLFMT